MDQDSSFVRGVLIGCVLSVPLWAAIVCVAVEVYRALVGG